jgi:excisionase family DNA binding protein
MQPPVLHPRPRLKPLAASVAEPNVFTVAETARRKGCTRQAVYNALDRGDLTEVRMGAQRLVARDDAFRRYEVQETGGRLHKGYQKRGT